MTEKQSFYVAFPRIENKYNKGNLSSIWYFSIIVLSTYFLSSFQPNLPIFLFLKNGYKKHPKRHHLQRSFAFWLTLGISAWTFTDSPHPSLCSTFWSPSDDYKAILKLVTK